MSPVLRVWSRVQNPPFFVGEDEIRGKIGCQIEHVDKLKAESVSHLVIDWGYFLGFNNLKWL